MTEEIMPANQPLKLGPLTLILSILALLAAVATITGEILGAETLVYFTKPLILVLIIAIAFFSYEPPSHLYKWTIIIGLLFSMIGDILLMLPQDLFLWGLISFAVAQLFYTGAFISGGGFYGNWRAAALFLLYGVFMAALLWTDLGEMRIPALVYLVIILVMAWQGYGHWRQTQQTRSKLAFIGVLLFVASDSFLAVNRWLYDFEDLAPILILGTYYAAQWLISQSAGNKHI